MHWDSGTWAVISTASTVILAVWSAVQGWVKVRAEGQAAREKIAREVADKEREREREDDPAVMRERRAVERGALDLDACWKQVGHWQGIAERLQQADDARASRWDAVGLTETEGLRVVRKWQQSLGRNAAKEYDAGGLASHGADAGGVDPHRPGEGPGIETQEQD